MTIDFRALCAELVTAFKDENTYTQRVEALDRARAALATPPLSPAAQAVLDAYYCDAPVPGSKLVAAALRALADQVVPDGGNFIAARIRDAILAIATELEAQ